MISPQIKTSTPPFITHINSFSSGISQLAMFDDTGGSKFEESAPFQALVGGAGGASAVLVGCSGHLPPEPCEISRRKGRLPEWRHQISQIVRYNLRTNCALKMNTKHRCSMIQYVLHTYFIIFQSSRELYKLLVSEQARIFIYII